MRLLKIKRVFLLAKLCEDTFLSPRKEKGEIPKKVGDLMAMDFFSADIFIIWSLEWSR